MTSFYEKVLQTIKANRMFERGDRVAVAVSGGADSLALLVLLQQLSTRFALKLWVAHYNHRLRGKESDADERFVHETAGRMGLECITAQEEVQAFARRKRMNLEAAARQCRYQFLQNLVSTERVSKVALGHTANDQAETFLMRLLRGAGMRGLSAIRPVMKAHFVRPLLEVRRDEVEQFLRDRGLSWREDSTNQDPSLMRNRIRKALLPELEEKYNPQIVPQLARTAAQCLADDAYLSAMASDWLTQSQSHIASGVSKPGIVLPVAGLLELASPIRSRVFRLAVEESHEHSSQIDESHFRAMEGLLFGPSGARLVLPRGLRVERVYDSLQFHNERRDPDRVEDFEIPFPVPGSVVLPWEGLEWRSRVVDGDSWAGAHSERTFVESGVGDIQRSRVVARFDYLKLTVRLRSAHSDRLTVRNVRRGDIYPPIGRKRAVKVRDLLAEQRMAASRRRRCPLLAVGEEVVWVRGCGESQSVAPTAASRQILVIDEVQSHGV